MMSAIDESRPSHEWRRAQNRGFVEWEVASQETCFDCGTVPSLSPRDCHPGAFITFRNLRRNQVMVRRYSKMPAPKPLWVPSACRRCWDGALWGPCGFSAPWTWAEESVAERDDRPTSSGSKSS